MITARVTLYLKLLKFQKTHTPHQNYSGPSPTMMSRLHLCEGTTTPAASKGTPLPTRPWGDVDAEALAQHIELLLGMDPSVEDVDIWSSSRC